MGFRGQFHHGQILQVLAAGRRQQQAAAGSRKQHAAVGSGRVLQAALGKQEPRAPGGDGGEERSLRRKLDLGWINEC